MIRIALGGQTLESHIDEHDANWRLTHAVWNGKSPWSDIKRVFVMLQNGKCAYCERRIQANLDENKYESDVEHYRPKNQTTLWVSKDNSSPARIGLVTGYEWLATNVWNYLLSCKTCNSELKKNNFPIAGLVGRRNSSIKTLNTREKPLLPYPIGDIDDDPEDLIDWDAFVPIPKFSESVDSFRYWRARITIELLKLNARDDILIGCAERICLVWDDLLNCLKTGKSFEYDLSLPHAACVRSFLRLAGQNPEQAAVVFRRAKQILATTNRYQK